MDFDPLNSPKGYERPAREDFSNLPDRNRKFGIPLNVHNIMDYVIGAMLILSPYVFGFADVTPARNVFLTVGVLLVVYSLFTRYRYSIAKIIPLGAHMAMDVIAGVFLMLAPSIWGYRPVLTGFQYGWHFIMGLGAILLVALTRSTPTASVVSLDERDTFRRAA